MQNYARNAAVSLFAGAALAAGALAPASAAPVFTGGLVNVTVVDAVDVTGVTVQVAAAVCGVSVQALVVDLGPDGFVSDCGAQNDNVTTVEQTRGNR